MRATVRRATHSEAGGAWWAGAPCGWLLGASPLENAGSRLNGHPKSPPTLRHRRCLCWFGPAVVADELLLSLPSNLWLTAHQDISIVCLFHHCCHLSQNISVGGSGSSTCWCACSVVSVALGEEHVSAQGVPTSRQHVLVPARAPWAGCSGSLAPTLNWKTRSSVIKRWFGHRCEK